VSLKNLLVIKFWDIVENNTLYLLDANYKKGKKYTEKEVEFLAKQWANLYDEFFSLRSNKSGKYQMEKNFELTKLHMYLEMLYELENRVILLINMENIEELVDFVIERNIQVIKDFKSLYPKIKINIFDSPSDVLKIIQPVIKSQTNIYDEKLGAKQKTVEKQRETIYDVVAMMSNSAGFAIDIESLTCMSFIAYENAIIAKSKAQSELNNKK
jgi:hypothetical protein